MLSLLAPHLCYGCQEPGNILCDRCSYDITEEDFGRCAWCLRPVADDHQCRACAARSPACGVWVVAERRDIVKSAVDGYKFEAMRGGADALVSLLDDTIPLLPADTLVTHVPTAPAHIRERGFDHAAHLARRFARRRHLGWAPLLMRRQALSQHELTRSARHKAADEAFGLRVSAIDHPVLLVDDILTTGATLQACTRLLRAAGASQVYVAVLARQMPHT